jgi:hypothetical protein
LSVALRRAETEDKAACQSSDGGEEGLSDFSQRQQHGATLDKAVDAEERMI